MENTYVGMGLVDYVEKRADLKARICKDRQCRGGRGHAQGVWGLDYNTHPYKFPTKK
jgi:hypothetical protein